MNLESLVWIANLLSVLAIWMQVFDIIKNKNVAGISVKMFCMFIFTQIVFAINGFVTKQYSFMVCQSLCLIGSVIVIFLVAFRGNDRTKS